MVIYGHVFGKAIQLKYIYIYVTLRAQRGAGCGVFGWGSVHGNAKDSVDAPEMTVEFCIINK